MASEQLGQMISAVAAADLSALQFRLMRVTGVSGTNPSVNVVTAATQAAVGVLQNAPISGAAATIATGGTSKVTAGATVAAGAEVMSDATGRVITAATAGSRVVGIALTGGAVGELIQVSLDHKATF